MAYSYDKWFNYFRTISLQNSMKKRTPFFSLFHVAANDKIILNLNALYSFAGKSKNSLPFPISAPQSQTKGNLDDEAV